VVKKRSTTYKKIGHFTDWIGLFIFVHGVNLSTLIMIFFSNNFQAYTMKAALIIQVRDTCNARHKLVSV
jgi:hypothetical protein